jgi:hypothetical protein
MKVYIIQTHFLVQRLLLPYFMCRVAKGARCVETLERFHQRRTGVGHKENSRHARAYDGHGSIHVPHGHLHQVPEVSDPVVTLTFDLDFTLN